MDVSVVIGANFGDEGKGVITDALACRRPDSVVVMTNGGAQRGHTVIHAPLGMSHSFHHFGSGTFRGCATYFPQSFVLNPMQFVKEFRELVSSFDLDGVESVRHRDCLFSTPFDMILNQDIERFRKARGNGCGTCGMGVWETLVRQKDKMLGFLPPLDDFNRLPHEMKVEALERIRDRYCPERYKSVTGEEWQPADWTVSDGLIEHFIQDVAVMCAVCPSDGDAPLSFLADKRNLIFENGQGLLLDEEYGACASAVATPSSTGMRQCRAVLDELSESFGVVPQRVDAYYVSRPYATLHGPPQVMKGISSECSLCEDSKEVNKGNEFQGDFRVARLDYKTQTEAINQDMTKYLNPLKAAEKTATLAYTHLDKCSPEKLAFREIAECGSPLGGMSVSGLRW